MTPSVSRRLREALLALVVVTLAFPALSFHAAKARSQSAALTEEQIAKSRALFREGVEAARRADAITAAYTVRAGLAINPAQADMHAFAASQFELGGASGKAFAHWWAARALYPENTPDGRRAYANMVRLEERLEQRGQKIRCVVLGSLRDAWVGACDDEGAAASAKPAPQSPPTVLIAQWGGDADLARTVRDIVVADLSRANRVTPVVLSQTLSDGDPLPASFAGAPQASWLLAGSVRTLADGRTNVRVYLWNLNTRAGIGGQSLSLRPEDLRRAAHQASDYVEGATVKVPGSHTLRLVRIEENQGSHSIVVMDSDGHGRSVALRSPKALAMPVLVEAPDAPAVLSYFSYETGKPQLYLQNLLAGQRAVDPNSDALRQCAPALAAFEAADAQGRLPYWGKGWLAADAACGASVRQRAVQHQAVLRDAVAPANAQAAAQAQAPAATGRPPGAPAGSRPALVLMVQDARSGKDVPRRVTTALLPVDGFDHSLCGRTFKLHGTLDDATRSFSCSADGAQVGTGTYVDGGDRGSFEWGYALDDDGARVRVKSYREWEDPRHPQSGLKAAQVLYRYTSGERAGKGHTTLFGPQEGSAYLYMFPDYFAR